MSSSLFLALVSLALCDLVTAQPLGPGWSHGWDNALGAQFVDFGYKALSNAEAAFVASHYQIVSLEKCTGNPTETTVWATAKQLKAINPKLKVLFYWDTHQYAQNCYAAHTEYMAHPEWWLKDDAGVLLKNEGNISMMDYTVAAARDWWVSVPLGGAGSPMSPWIDGVLADNTGALCKENGAFGGYSPDEHQPRTLQSARRREVPHDKHVARDLQRNQQRICHWERHLLLHVTTKHVHAEGFEWNHGGTLRQFRGRVAYWETQH